eukprot:6179887-Pleurochrysis_carterae.AAC.5
MAISAARAARTCAASASPCGSAKVRVFKKRSIASRTGLATSRLRPCLPLQLSSCLSPLRSPFLPSLSVSSSSSAARVRQQVCISLAAVSLRMSRTLSTSSAGASTVLSQSDEDGCRMWRLRLALTLSRVLMIRWGNEVTVTVPGEAVFTLATNSIATALAHGLNSLVKMHVGCETTKSTCAARITHEKAQVLWVSEHVGAHVGGARVVEAGEWTAAVILVALVHQAERFPRAHRAAALAQAARRVEVCPQKVNRQQ